MKLKDKFEILSTLIHDLVSHDLLYDSLKCQNFVPTKSYSSRWYFNGCWSLSCERATSKNFRSLKKYDNKIPQEKVQEVNLLQSKPLKQIGIFNEALSLIPEGGNPPPSQLLRRTSLLMEKKTWKEVIPLLEKIVRKKKIKILTQSNL